MSVSCQCPSIRNVGAIVANCLLESYLRNEHVSDRVTLLQVKEFSAHDSVVNDLSFDLQGEYIGSCSDDGSVVINSLFTDDEIMKFEYHRPMKAIALDPDYARKTSRRFIAGGLAGNLYLNSKKWLGYRDQVCIIIVKSFSSTYVLDGTFGLLTI